MANEDGAVGRDSADDGPHPPTRRPADVVEPTTLLHDWPGPHTWRPVLGPGGEELVSVGSERPAARASADESRRSDTRRGPRSTPDAPEPHAGARSHRRWSFPRPSLGTLLGAGAASGLLGLVALLGVVLFSSDGSLPAARDAGTVAALSVPSAFSSNPAEWIAASARLEARVRESAARQRQVAHDDRQRARRRERQERPTPAVQTTPRTTQVAAPARSVAPAADPWAGISAAEREFTPGPWNLN